MSSTSRAPAIRFAVFNGIRLTPCTIKIVTRMISIKKTTSSTNRIRLPASTDLPNSAKNAPGNLERIPTVINNETPLPIPFSVIRSPNQTANIDPAIKIRIV